MGERVLVIDTCGENAGVALAEGNRIAAVTGLAGRMASAEIVGVVRALLQRAGWALGDLDGVGVVSGPGAFTGVRTGLAAAKGLCEGAGLRLVAVSRLAVLEHAAPGQAERVALYAGRGEVYVRERATGREWLAQIDSIDMIDSIDTIDTIDSTGALETHSRWAVAEARVAESLQAVHPVLVPLHAADALPLVLAALLAGAPDAALVDGNYVRAESQIYKKAAPVTA